MSPEDAARIEDLLQDDSLSYREISRQTGYSDFTIRAVARKLSGDPRPLKRAHPSDPDDAADESLGLGGWGIIAGVVGLFIGMIWLSGRNLGPPEF